MPDFGRWNGGGDPSFNEINRTEQFLDALSNQQQPYATDRGEAELAQLLAGWRDDVRETPMGHVVTVAQAETALGRVARPAPRRRLSLAVVGSAAAAVLAIGGFGAVIAGSGPGDALYGLRSMLFGEQMQTRDDAVALVAQTEMQQVQQLIEQGDWQGAQAKLEAVTTTVATVDDAAQKEELIAQWQELSVKVEAQDPVATVPPGAPLPTFPEVTPPVVDQGTSPSGTPGSSETTVPGSSSPTTSAPSTSAPSTSAPTSSETTEPSSSAVSPAPSTAPGTTSVGVTPSSTVAPSPSASPSSIPPSVTTTVSPAPTSTTVVLQSTTTVTPPRTTAPRTTSAAAPVPTAVPPVIEETIPSAVVPAVPALPTTTTPFGFPGLPGLPALPGFGG